MEAYYTAPLNPTETSTSRAAYRIWREQHASVRLYLDSNKIPITENSEVTILWDMPVHTYREIKANRPDIVVKDKKERNKVHAH